MYLSTTTIKAATRTNFTVPTLTRAVALFSLEDTLFIVGGDSQLQRWSSLIGIVTAIVGNILISFALNIQRYAHIRLEKERLEEKEKLKALGKGLQKDYGTTPANGNIVEDGIGRESGEDEPLRQSFHSADSMSTACSDSDHKSKDSTYLSSPYWWGGIILMTVGEAGNFLAYGFAPASIVSPLGVVALISNCVIAPIMLKERFRLRDFWGVVVAVAGAVTVVLSAKQGEKKLGPHEILDAITTTVFEAYMGITIFMIVVLMWASPRYGSKTILVDLGLVGLFGGYTALSTKGVASMLSSTLWRALTTPITYVLLVVLVGTAIMQIRYVNNALQRFDSTQVIPVQFVMFTLSVIIGSAVLYGDFYHATADNVAKFVGGCLLTFFGVWLITSGRGHGDDDEDTESDEEIEERIGLANQESAGQEGQYYDETGSTVRRKSKTEILLNGDSANDDRRVVDSRRSSKVSFADQSLRPGSSRLYSNASVQPSMRLPQSETVSATEASPLLTNPWRSSADDLLASRHPGMVTTTSSPVLPTEAQAPSSSSLSAKPGTPRASSQANLHTHPNQQQGPSPPHVDRPVTPARHSISRMMPGPLLSPLSGGLSVVIADSLRRGVDSHGKHLKRLRRSKSTNHRLTPGNSEAYDEIATSPLRKSDTAQETSISKSLGNDEGRWSRMTRARSMSNTLGDFLKGKRQRNEQESGDEEEAGPSGS